jgi:hypothetical protein
MEEKTRLIVDSEIKLQGLTDAMISRILSPIGVIAIIGSLPCPLLTSLSHSQSSSKSTSGLLRQRLELMLLLHEWRRRHDLLLIQK